MSLWTDCDFVTGAELQTLDGEVLSVAASIDLVLDDPNSGVIHRSLAESANKLMNYQQTFGGYLSTQSVSSNHYAAVMNIGLPAVNRSRVLINQVVATSLNASDWPAIKTWAAYRALAFVFQQAANTTTKDRYQTKADRYTKLADGRYFEAMKTLGLPIVRQPLPCPGALYDPTVTGAFDNTCVTTVAGAGTDTSTQFDIAITWVAGAGTASGLYAAAWNKGNCESAPSARVTMPANANTGLVFQVNIAGLTPPTGVQGPSTVNQSVVQYGKATGFNIYAGLKGGPLFLQNATPVPVATNQVVGGPFIQPQYTTATTYTFAADPVQSGYVADTGQYPDLFFTFQQMIQRG